MKNLGSGTMVLFDVCIRLRSWVSYKKDADLYKIVWVYDYGNKA